MGLVRSLSALGHEILVYGSSPNLPRGPGITIYKSPPWISYNAWPLAGLFRLLWNLIVLPAKLSGQNIQAVISQNAEGAIWCSIPQLLVVHDLIPLCYPKEAPRLRSYYTKLLPHVLGHSAAIVAVSQHTRNDILQYYKLRPGIVHVAYDGVEQPSLEAQPARMPLGSPTGPYFLFVGTFSPRKNLQTLVRALGQAQGDVRESLLIVAYPDKWTSECMELAKKLGLSDRVIHLSGLADQEMAYLYAHATALFLLSEYEGFGLPALEAMAAGTPAVVSDSTALAEVVADAAVKINAHDSEAVARAMQRLSTDSAYRKELARRGVERARTFTWLQTGRRISEILSGIIHRDDKNSQAVTVPQ